MVDISDSVSTELLAEYLSSTRPLVSVICISYNHERFIKAALYSVLTQTYSAVELIVIDNNSTDQTVKQVEEIIRFYPQVRFIRNTENTGICRAFNQGLSLAKGRYVIDLSADDVIFPDRLARQVATFERLPGDYAVVFSNAALIDEKGNRIGYHFPIDRQRRTMIKVPSGWIFKEVLTSYFVCTPTMMMRKDILDSLGGYDESLSYEDFDFWVRTSRLYRYYYQDEVLTSKRIVRSSLSAKFSEVACSLLSSTLAVCYKAFDQCQSAEEYHALADRIRWFIRCCFYAQQFELAFRYKELLDYLEEPGWLTHLVLMGCKWKIPVNGLYQWYSRRQMRKQVAH